MRIWITAPRKDTARKEYGYRVQFDSPTEERAFRDLYPKMATAGYAKATQRASKAWADSLRAEVDKRLHDIHMGRALPVAVSWEEVRDGYLKWGRARGGLHDTPWTSGVIAHKEKYLKDWGSLLNLRTMADVTAPKVEAIKTEWKAQGRANVTINCRVDALAGATKWARKMGLISTDPLEGIGRFGKATERKRGAFEPEELRLLFTETPLEDSLVYQLAYFTGYRESELRSLKVSDVDLIEGFIFCRHTKNKKAAAQPIPDSLRPVLWAWCAERSPEEPLLVISENHPERRLYSHMKRLGIPRNDRRGLPRVFHSLRHSTATSLAKTGIRTDLLQAHMRHSNFSQTLGYIDRDTSEARAGLNALSTHILGELHTDNTAGFDMAHNARVTGELRKNGSESHPFRQPPQSKLKPRKTKRNRQSTGNGAPRTYGEAVDLATRALHALHDAEFADQLRALLAKRAH